MNSSENDFPYSGDALCLRLAPDPRSMIQALRGHSGMQRNDMIWGAASGMIAPLFGSVLTITLWIGLIGNLASTAIGRFPFRLDRTATICVVAAGLYGAVEIIFTFGHSGARGFHYLPAQLIYFAPVFYLLRARLNNAALLTDIFVMGAGFSAILALPLAGYEALWLGVRAESLCGNPNVFAVVAALFGSIGALNVMAPTDRRRVLGLLSFVAMVLCVLASGRRALWPALPVLAVVVAWASATVVPAKQFRRGVVAALVVAAIIVVSSSGYLWQRVSTIGADLARIEATGDFDSSTGRRILMLEAGWEAVKKAPVLGYGVAGRMDAVRANAPEDKRDLIEFTHPHNGFLAALLDAGVAGFASLLLLLVSPLWIAIASPNDPARRLRIAIAAILVICFVTSGLFGIMFQHDLMESAFLTILIVLAASASHSHARRRRQTETPDATPLPA